MTTTVRDVSEIVEAIRKVNRDIKDYFWMSEQVTKSEVETYIQSTKHNVESTLPIAPYSISDPTYRVVQRRMRIEERKKRLVEKVVRLEGAVHKLDNERERIVIEGLMDNMTLREIGALIGLSKQGTHEIKEKAIKKLAIKMYLEKEVEQ